MLRQPLAHPTGCLFRTTTHPTYRRAVPLHAAQPVFFVVTPAPAPSLLGSTMKRGHAPFTSKLRPDMQPEVVPDPKGRGQMLLPTPLLLAEEICAIPAGTLFTLSELRLRLTRRHAADLVCPLMTGIFYNLLAGAAEEQLQTGQKPIAPYWRVIRDDGSLSPKTPDGPEVQAAQLRREGYILVQAKGKWLVEGRGKSKAAPL